jgi:3-hydroxymyristoyl/3-hydroxydecanoyl-(acyl carrier protein) dehydratase
VERIGIEEIRGFYRIGSVFDALQGGRAGTGFRAKAVKAVSANEWFFQGHFAETKVCGRLIVKRLRKRRHALLTQKACRQACVSGKDRKRAFL